MKVAGTFSELLDKAVYNGGQLPEAFGHASQLLLRGYVSAELSVLML